MNTGSKENDLEADDEWKSKLQRVKQNWYYKSPMKLYDLCMNVLVNRIELLVVRNDALNGNQFLSTAEHQCSSSNKSNKKTSSLSATQLKSKLTVNKSNLYKIESSGADASDDNDDDLENESKNKRFKSTEMNITNKNSKQTISQQTAVTNPIKQLKHAKQLSRYKYKLNEHLANAIPDSIADSLLDAYLKFYLDHLGRLERDEYFDLSNSFNNKKRNLNTNTQRAMNSSQTSDTSADDLDLTQNANSLSSSSSNCSSSSFFTTMTQTNATQTYNKKNLVTYYDLLMSFAMSSNKFSKLDYRQCLWAHSTLEQRLLSTNTNSTESNIQQQQTANSKSLRAKQKTHLDHKDLKTLLKAQKNLTHIDLCTCLLRNKSIRLLNRHLGDRLKYLRLQNCCNYQADSNHDDEVNNNINNNNNVNNVHHANNLNNFQFIKKWPRAEPSKKTLAEFLRQFRPIDEFILPIVS